jgi:outer membrane protein
MPLAALRLRSLGGAFAAACAVLLAPRCVHAESRPLWEFGLGPGVVRFNDYPGSLSHRSYLVPFPYIRYRGKFLRSDREGMRGIVFDQPRASFNISLWATVPSHSGDDTARAGMPNLDAMVQFGPSLDLHLWRSEGDRMQLDLRMPVRVAFTVASPPRNAGWVAAPHLNLDIRHMGAAPGWDLGILAGPLFATQRYNEYFYSVAPAYATAQRPAYDAPAGYAGTEIITALSRRFRNFWVGGFLRYETLHGAVFGNSPLIQTQSDLSGGLGFAWVFARSARDVEASE